MYGLASSEWTKCTPVLLTQLTFIIGTWAGCLLVVSDPLRFRLLRQPAKIKGRLVYHWGSLTTIPRTSSMYPFPYENSVYIYYITIM